VSLHLTKTIENGDLSQDYLGKFLVQHCIIVYPLKYTTYTNIHLYFSIAKSCKYAHLTSWITGAYGEAACRHWLGLFEASG
jgi:hypothetical protein